MLLLLLLRLADKTKRPPRSAQNATETS